MRTRRAIAFACALKLVSGAASGADIAVSGSAALRQALADAAPGDRILIAPGAYGALDLRNRRYSPILTVTAADPASAPVFTSILLSEAGGVVLSGLRVVYGPTQAPLSSYAVNILDSADIWLSGLEISSAENGVAGDDAYGVNIRDSARVTVNDSLLHDVYRGVAVLDSDDVEIRRNIIRKVGSDGIVARGALGLSILDNYFSDFAIIDLNVQHPDAIQLWSRDAPRANQNVTIRGNLIRRGAGDPSQGIFIKTPELATRNLLIEHNVIEQSMAQGIFVENGDGVVIRDNTVIPADYLADKPGVEIRTPFANTTVSGNIAMAYRVPAGVAASQNVTADYFNPWIAAFVGAHLQNPANPSDPADFAPVGAAGARSFVRDPWPGDPSAPTASLDPPPIIADLDFTNGIVDSAPDPVAVGEVRDPSGALYFSSAASPKLSAALNLSIDARARLPSTAAGWRLLAAVPNSYDVRIDRGRIRFSVWTQGGVTRLDGVSPALPDLAAHDVKMVYDGAAGLMTIAVNEIEIARRTAPLGPIAYNPTQRLYIGGAPWGLFFGDGIERVTIRR